MTIIKVFAHAEFNDHFVGETAVGELRLLAVKTSHLKDVGPYKGYQSSLKPLADFAQQAFNMGLITIK